MENVYSRTSIMSFDKVPCTPVTGAYVNFFDVFGDVERVGLGSGSSHDSGTTTAYCSTSNIKEEYDDDDDERHERANHVVKIISSEKRKCSRCNSHNAYMDPHITFLQEKQVEILGALHDEIRTLKSENADLKFQIHVILNDPQDGPLFHANTYRGKMVPSTPETYLGDLNANRITKDRERTLELELESAAKMIEELKWVKLHYEKQIQGQENKIADLERQLRYPRSTNCNTPLQQITAATTDPTAMVDSTEPLTWNRPLKSGRQSSSSTNHLHGLMNRRNSSQSLLPDDYKKAVATLPPILANMQSNPGSPVNVFAINTEPSANGEESNGKSRKSAFSHSSKRSLNENIKNNNTSSFIGEKPGHLGGTTQFYYSK